jgi:hypothetical protein
MTMKGAVPQVVEFSDQTSCEAFKAEKPNPIVLLVMERSAHGGGRSGPSTIVFLG